VARVRIGLASGRRQYLAAALFPLVVLTGCGAPATTAPPHSTLINPTRGAAGCGAARSAFQTHRSKLWLTVSAHVTRDLADAHGTYTHQRFIVTCSGGFTLLIVNDISIGERAPAHIGDTVTVRGQYIWNDQGGLIHFTHHDPEGGPGGYIDEDGAQYS
jgi:hypothetical protein